MPDLTGMGRRQYITDMELSDEFLPYYRKEKEKQKMLGLHPKKNADGQKSDERSKTTFDLFASEKTEK